MSLREYQHKRNFAITAEPRDVKVTAGRAPIFVVQLHHARSRHYDFRLQMGDVLKSWAVPKGPSYDPQIKRLAVEVEDHPLAYAKFEGDIPQGQYGAGHVQIFDHGTWSPIVANAARTKSAIDAAIAKQLRNGHLQFELNGERLHGNWHLVRTHRAERQPQWMLFKAHDDYASKVEADDLLGETHGASKNKKSSRVAVKTRATHSTAGSSQAAATRANGKAAAVRSKKKPATRATRDWTQLALAIDNARKRKLTPGAFEPELARSVAAAPSGSNWLHENKWDGYRLLTTVNKGRVELWSRNALEWTERVPEVAKALDELRLDNAQLDGELIAVKAGKSDFNELQAVLAGENTSPLVYAVFDLLHINGVSLRNCSLLDRKELLQQVLQASGSTQLLYSEHHIGDGPQVFDLASQQGLEGIVSKRTTAAYRAGRGNDWLKVKSTLSDEFAIVGYTQPRGSRQGIGALLLARPSAKNRWHFMGRMGSGLSELLLRKLGNELPKTRTDEVPVDDQSLVDRDIGKASWVKPRYVVEVYYRGIGKEGLLRQASLKALREDKSVADLRKRPDTPIAPSAKNIRAHTAVTPNKAAAQSLAAREKTPMQVSAIKAPARAKKTSMRAMRRSKSNRKQLELDYITHPQRRVYPADGITKLQVAEYYEQVMPWLLPQIVNRPLSLVRCPSNVKTCFFQKHHGEQFGDHVHAVRVRNSEGDVENYLYVKAAAGVRDLVQMNVVEFHPWGATIDDIDKADLITFDLDPGPRVTWPRVIEGAELLHELLNNIGLQSFVKTSGGKGLHVVVPLKPAQPWAWVKQSCKQIASAISKDRPKEFIDVAGKSQRVGKIFIDYLRNGRGATSVAAYSLRARATAPVAMPFEWRAIRKTQSGADYRLENTPQYLQTRKQDPWRGMATIKQQIKAGGS